MRYLIVLVFACLLQGCVTMIESGRDFPVAELDQLVPGVTTYDDVIAHFGKPIVITRNSLENRMVLGYVSSLDRAITLGLPPVFLYSWKSGTSANLNIIFVDNLYRGHELKNSQ